MGTKFNFVEMKTSSIQGKFVKALEGWGAHFGKPSTTKKERDDGRMTFFDVWNNSSIDSKW